jgi:hypothetical protein
MISGLRRVIDIIGDVHVQFDKLVTLLTHLGYRDGGGAFRHPDRSVVFVGDLQGSLASLLRALATSTSCSKCAR